MTVIPKPIIEFGTLVITPEETIFGCFTCEKDFDNPKDTRRKGGVSLWTSWGDQHMDLPICRACTKKITNALVQHKALSIVEDELKIREIPRES